MQAPPLEALLLQGVVLLQEEPAPREALDSLTGFLPAADLLAGETNPVAVRVPVR